MKNIDKSKLAVRILRLFLCVLMLFVIAPNNTYIRNAVSNTNTTLMFCLHNRIIWDCYTWGGHISKR